MATKRPYAARLPVDDRREQLLSAALDIALERGFHAVTIDGVAKAAGVTRPVVYGLYAGRDALLDALVDRAEQRATTALAELFPDAPDDADPDVLLLAGIAGYLAAVAADPATWRVVLLPPEGAPAGMAERVEARRAMLLAQLRDLAEWGLARRAGPALDPELFARAVFALAEAAARLLLDEPERWRQQDFLTFAATTLDGLRRTPPPGS